jgi:hypothetical protein
MAFDELHNSIHLMEGTIFEKDRDTTFYQLFCLAATLNTGRVNDISKLNILFEEDKLLTKPMFVYLFTEAIEILDFSNQSRLIKDYKLESKKKKYLNSIRFFLDNPSEDLRFTSFEKFNPIKNIEIYTEGKTDASIISHAFRILTMNEEPYWNITAVENLIGSKAGGAQQLANRIIKLSNSIEIEFDKKKTIIAIFDNDSKGFQEFNGLPNNFKKQNEILKKADNLNIYALLLPIPEDDSFKQYHQDKQSFKFFEIEHYFSIELLKEQNMVEETSIPSVYEIKNSKTEFNEHILKIAKKEILH